MTRIFLAFLGTFDFCSATLVANPLHAQTAPAGARFVLEAPIPPNTGAAPVATTATLTPSAPRFVLGAPAATPAHWEGLTYIISDVWACSPVAALTGYQLNLKTSTFQQGVSLGAGFGCRYTGWSIPLAIEAVGGFAANSNAPNAVQGNLIFVVADNFGLGAGSQVFKDPVTNSYTGQMLVSFFLTGSWASTIEQAKKIKAQAAMDNLGYYLKGVEQGANLVKAVR